MTEHFVVETVLTPAERQVVASRMETRLAGLVPPPGLAGRVAIGFAVALLGGLAAVLLGIATTRTGNAVAALLMLAYVAGLWAQHAAASRYARRCTAARLHASPLTAATRFTIAEAGIDVSGTFADAAWRWAAFSATERAQGMLLFWAGSVHGFGIPLRAFADEAEATRAQDFARARIPA